LLRQAAFLFKLSKTAADPELAATLVKTAADLKDAADSLDGDTDIETQTKKAKWGRGYCAATIQFRNDKFEPVSFSARKRRDVGGGTMQDMKTHLEKLQVQIAECQMIRDLATDPNKRELFGRLAAHFNVLAREIETSMADLGPQNRRAVSEVNGDGGGFILSH
jgi:hypothetical protein